MKKQDLILIAAVLAVAGVLLLFLYGGGAHSGAYVQVETDGTVTDTLPLNEDAVLVLHTKYGTNTLTVRDGCASVTDADWPDKICVHHHKIRKNGESIICLPHKTVITVVDKASGEEIDA